MSDIKRIYQVPGGFARPHFRIKCADGYHWALTCDENGKPIPADSPPEPAHQLDEKTAALRQKIVPKEIP